MSSTARTKAASSTAMESPSPNELARLEAVLSEPEMLLASFEALVTVTDGSAFWISVCTAEMSLAVSAVT